MPGVSFVGDYFVTTDQLLNPNIQPWLLLFRRTALTGIMPTVVVGATCLLVGRYFLSSSRRRSFSSRRQIIGITMVLYWLPILLVSGFSSGAEERYLLHVHPLGFLLFVFLIADLFHWQNDAVGVAAALNGHSAYALAPAVVDSRHWRPVRTPHEDDDDNWPLKPAATTTAVVQEEAVAKPLSRSLALALLGAVVVIGAGIRLYHLNHLSLWLDEGFTVLYSRLSWKSVLGLNGFYSPHPPLFFTLVKVVSLAVSDQYAARVISVVCAIATLPVFYALANRLMDRRAALVATGVLAISPLNVYYAQEARMYALLVFLVALTYLAIVAFWQGPSWRWAALYGVAGLLAMYVDYSAVYALAPQAIPLAFIAFRHGRRARTIGWRSSGRGFCTRPGYRRYSTP